MSDHDLPLYIDRTVKHEKDGLIHALRHFSVIAETIGGRELAVFLDYDGTLTPIVARPELAQLDEAMRETLRRVGERFATAVISGRACRDVRSLVGLDCLYYAGNHGLEIEGPRGVSQRHELGREFRPDMAACAERIAAGIGDVEGVLIEDKGLSLSVHYRLVSAVHVPEVSAAVQEIVVQFPRLHTRSGKKVIEIRPRIDWDKGRAVQWLLELLDRELMPVYIGDDETDEDAFVVLTDAVRIRVGEGGASSAEYRLDDTQEVRALLERLIATQGDART